MSRKETREDVLAALSAVQAQIVGLEQQLDAAYRRRSVLFAQGREAIDPRIPYRVMGEACGIKEEAVVNALRKPRNAAPSRSPARSGQQAS